MYALLHDQDDNLLDTEEKDKIKKLEIDWEKLVVNAEKKRSSIHTEQARFKKELLENVSNFVADVVEFK